MKKILLQLSKLMSVRMLAIGLTFVQTILLTRVLGGELFGLFSFALSISALLTLVLSLGVDQVIMRDISRIGVGRIHRMAVWRDQWHLVMRLVVPLTLSVVVIGLWLALATDVFGGYAITVAAGFFILPVVMMRKYVESIVLGTKAVLRSIVGSQIVYPLLMILGGGCILLLGTQPSVTLISWIYIGATLGSLALSVALGWLVFKRLFRGSDTLEGESPGRQAILKSSAHFALVSLGFVMGQHVDVLLTGVLAGPEQVSIVRIASRVAELAALMRAIVVLQYKPRLAEAHGKGDISCLRRHVRLMTTIFVCTGAPLTFGLWIFADQVMSIFGAEFTSGAWVMRIYVLGVFFTLLSGPCTSLLSMCGYEHYASRFVWCALFINVVLDLALIPVFGALGCAIANMISMLFIAVVSTLIVIRALNINPSFLGLVTQTSFFISRQAQRDDT